MYLIETITAKPAMLKPSRGVEFAPAEVARADRLEIWCSPINEPGGDHNDFILKSGAEIIAMRRQEGY